MMKVTKCERHLKNPQHHNPQHQDGVVDITLDMQHLIATTGHQQEESEENLLRQKDGTKNDQENLPPEEEENLPPEKDDTEEDQENLPPEKDDTEEDDKKIFID